MKSYEAASSTITLFDTTLRDGAQSMGISFSIEDKVRIAQALDEFGIPFIEGGWPGSNPKDTTFFKKMSKIPLKNAMLTAFTSTRLKNIRVEDDVTINAVCESCATAVAVFGKSWDMHVYDALETTLEENIAMIGSTVGYLRKRFKTVIYDAEHFFDGYRANPDYALATVHAAANAGADWIVLCDTNGGTLPRDIATTCQAVAAIISVPLGIHAHNDGELAVANSIAAVESGVRMVQGTINGLGERCGNANLCSLIPAFELKMGKNCVPHGGLKKLTDLSRMVSDAANCNHPEYLPYVGRNAFAHKGGIHVSAVRKNSACYEHIIPHLVGNDRVMSVSELSGKGNILAKAEALGIVLDYQPEVIHRVVSEVKEREGRGYYYDGAEASFELLLDQLIGRKNDYFTVHGFHVLTFADTLGIGKSQATIRATVPDWCQKSGFEGIIEQVTAHGNGPVEALDNALRALLGKFYPCVTTVKLSDYKVRILDEGAGTAATTRVVICSTDGKQQWCTVGVSDNIIDASWQALCESLIYALKRNKGAITADNIDTNKVTTKK